MSGRTVPGLAGARSGRASPFLFQWEAADGLDPLGRLIARTGQIGAFSRGGTVGAASSVDANGYGHLVGKQQPRFYHQYNPLTGLWENRGVILEGQRKNTVIQCDDLATGWTNGGVGTMTRTPAYAMRAGRSFTRFVIPAGNTNYMTATFTADGTKAFSIFVCNDALSAGDFDCGIRDLTAGNVWRAQIRISVSAAGVVTAAAVGGVGVVLAVQSLGDSAYRVLCQAPGIIAANTNNAYSASVVTANLSVLASCVMAEDGALPSTAITTSGSTVTRSADALSFAVNFPPQALSAYFKIFLPFGVDTSADQDRFIIGDTTAGFRVWPSGSAIRAHLYGTTPSDSQTNVTIAAGDTLEMLGTLSDGGVATVEASINGGALSYGVPGAAGTMASAWHSLVLDFNPTGDTFACIQSARVKQYVQTMATMRAA